MRDDLRVLTVRQPWAWALIHGGKDVENRVRNIAGSYRGPVAIHVAKADADNAPLPLWLEAANHGEARQPRSAVIGVVNLWAVHKAAPRCCPNRGARPFGSPWAMADHWHLCVTDPRPLSEPIPATGRLGLWRPTPELADAIRAQPPSPVSSVPDTQKD